ncbi:MAG: recombination protein NinG [Treponema sp.]|jgi:hypothetical protein|nr:recombination protein NinG [Treponema sp.]
MAYRIKKTSNPKKATAWRNFSKMIRIRDAIETTGTTTHVRCITCGKTYPIEKTDAGHALPGRTNAILFDEELCFAQCRICNRNNGGEQMAYKMVLTARHGPDWWELKESHKRECVHYTDLDYEQLSRLFREQTKKMLGGLK